MGPILLIVCVLAIIGGIAQTNTNANIGTPAEGTPVDNASKWVANMVLLLVGVPLLLFILFGATFVGTNTGQEFKIGPQIARDASGAVNNIGEEWERRQQAGEIQPGKWIGE